MHDREGKFIRARNRIIIGSKYDSGWEDIDFWAFCMWNIKNINLGEGIFSDRTYEASVINTVIWKAMLHRLASLISAERARLAEEGKKQRLVQSLEGEGADINATDHGSILLEADGEVREP